MRHVDNANYSHPLFLHHEFSDRLFTHMGCISPFPASTTRLLRQAAAGVTPATRHDYEERLPHSFRAWGTTTGREAARSYAFGVLATTIGVFGAPNVIDGWRLVGWFATDATNLRTHEATEALRVWAEAGPMLDACVAGMSAADPEEHSDTEPFFALIGSWAGIAAARLWMLGEPVEHSGLAVLRALDRQGLQTTALGLPGPPDADDPSAARKGMWLISSLVFSVGAAINIAHAARRHT